MDKLLLFLVTLIAGVMAQTQLGKNIAQPSMKMLKVAYDIESDKNLILSPLSILLLLVVYNLGTAPSVKKDINELLGGPEFSNAQIQGAYINLCDALFRLDPALLTIANKVYVSNRFSLNDTFVSAAHLFHSDAEAVDFSQKEATAAIINKWSAEKTHGIISNPMKASMLSDSMVAMLVNTIYFKGHWDETVEFLPFNTKDKDFYINKLTLTKKPTMQLTLTNKQSNVRYTECPALDARILVLPYKESMFRMAIVLPNEVDGLSDVLTKAADYNNLIGDIKNAHAIRSLIFEMPKFEIRNKLNIDAILRKAGAGKIFDVAAPGIVINARVPLSGIFQEAYIQVDEKGTTAAAFSSGILGFSPSALPTSYVYFIADHPFMYLILYEDKIMFAGTYTH